MQRKPVPLAPTSLDRVWSVRDAAPLVPEPADDCCRRLVERTDVHDRGTASAWLVFLAALGVVDDTQSGYARTRDAPSGDELAPAYRDNVFLAADCVDALGAEPQTPADVFEAVRDRVPQWERAKRDNWAAFWTERVERRLDWAVLLGLAERTADGYVA